MQLMYEQQHQLSEERRLCYVAFTRAKERLILTYAQSYGEKKHYPSQFLHEINYTRNPDCCFVKELEEKYSEPAPIPSASRFSYVLHSNNFDELLPSIIQPQARAAASVVREQKPFSPSALRLFSECEKQYEYQSVHALN